MTALVPLAVPEEVAPSPSAAEQALDKLLAEAGESSASRRRVRRRRGAGGDR